MNNNQQHHANGEGLSSVQNTRHTNIADLHDIDQNESANSQQQDSSTTNAPFSSTGRTRTNPLLGIEGRDGLTVM